MGNEFIYNSAITSPKVLELSSALFTAWAMALLSMGTDAETRPGLFATTADVYIAELLVLFAVTWPDPLPLKLSVFEPTSATWFIESGSENKVSGGGADLPDPPKTLAMSEIRPPRPVMLLSPPPSALETPPETALAKRLCHAPPLADEVDVLLLEGFPNCTLLSFGSDDSEKDFKPKDDVVNGVSDLESAPPVTTKD